MNVDISKYKTIYILARIKMKEQLQYALILMNAVFICPVIFLSQPMFPLKCKKKNSCDISDKFSKISVLAFKLKSRIVVYTGVFTVPESQVCVQVRLMNAFGCVRP